MEPSPEIQSIIEKSASFVAKFGQDFEKQMIQNEAGNPKFSFLKSQDPFYTYYQQRIAYFKNSEQNSSQPQQSLKNPNNNGLVPGAPSSNIITIDPTAMEEETETVVQEPKRGPNYISQRVVATRKKKSKGLTEFPLESFIIDIPSDISAFDLDIIKLTAQFVARNGHQFQVGILNREHKNPQFDFLKNNHFHYGFFASLVEAYTKCLIPPPKFTDRLKSDYNDKQTILDRLILRYDIERKEEDFRKAQKEAEDKVMIENAAIDWHDFVVVETIEFFDNEDEEQAPDSPAANVENKPSQMETDADADMDMDMDMEEEQPKPRPPSEMKIRKDYVKPTGPVVNKSQLKYQMCPKCGQEIAVEDFEEHMKLELLDYRSRAQRLAQQELDKSKNAPLASDDEISGNLRTFARRRTDIFGGEELEIGQSSDRTDNNNNKDDLIWDGTSGSIPRTMSAVLAGRTLDDQIAAIHASKGVVRDEKIPSNVPQATSRPQPPPLISQQPPPPPQSLITHSLGGLPIKYANQPPPPPPTKQPLPPSLLPTPQPPPTGLPSKYAQQPPPRIGGVALVSPPSGMLMNINHPPPTPEPTPKRQKVDESSFIPEDEFLAKFKGPITINVQIPKEESKPEWKLQGQTISLTVDLKDTITLVKEKLKELVLVPANKQKIKTLTLPILKDQQTLASYNVMNGTTFILGLKERGGKNK